jgi:hypothetical protein
LDVILKFKLSQENGRTDSKEETQGWEPCAEGKTKTKPLRRTVGMCP